jgi:predicted transposase/invertase (TIGR01784 family)
MLKPSRFLDPKSGIVFKKIFGQHPHLAKSFLNGVLPIESPIEDIEYLPTEQVPTIPVLKNTIVDVKCKDEQGRIFIVEMQLQWTTHFMKRLLFGASKAYVQQLRHGEDYRNLHPVYGLGLINETFDHESQEWFHHYRTVNVKQPERVLEGLELVFVELPKFTPQTWNDRKLGVLWLRFLKELDEKFTEVPQEFFDQPEIYEAMALAQESAYSPGELDTYDRYWDALRVESTLIGDAYSKGQQEGIEKGIEKGMEKEKREIAQKMLATGIDLNTISAITGLSLPQIQNLKPV